MNWDTAKYRTLVGFQDANNVTVDTMFDTFVLLGERTAHPGASSTPWRTCPLPSVHGVLQCDATTVVLFWT